MTPPLEVVSPLQRDNTDNTDNPQPEAPHLWDRQPGETAQAYARFRVWLGTPAFLRSFAMLGKAAGVSREAIRQQAERHRWRERADAPLPPDAAVNPDMHPDWLTAMRPRRYRDAKPGPPPPWRPPIPYSWRKVSQPPATVPPGGCAVPDPW